MGAIPYTRCGEYLDVVSAMTIKSKLHCDRGSLLPSDINARIIVR